LTNQFATIADSSVSNSYSQLEISISGEMEDDPNIISEEEDKLEMLAARKKQKMIKEKEIERQKSLRTPSKKVDIAQAIVSLGTSIKDAAAIEKNGTSGSDLKDELKSIGEKLDRNNEMQLTLLNALVEIAKNNKTS
jgi:hypothetical protein